MAAENVEAEASSSFGPKVGIGSKGPTLPSGPRVGISLRKPPSLSTLAMPNFAGMRTISPAGAEALSGLIALLPPENRDLLLTVTELITATSARSKETKMPLGNLLVVFCPSLNMNPSLLRVFCDAKEIWNPPPRSPPSAAAPAEPLPSITLQKDESEPEAQTPSEIEADVPVARPRPGGSSARDPLATLYVPNEQNLSSFYQRSSSNSGSYVSALEGPSEVDTRPSTPSLGSPCRLPPLSSSTDSLATPSTMSEASSSFSQPPSLSSQSSTAESNQKPEITVSAEPVIVENTDLALTSVPRRPAISSPIPFPSTSDHSTPHTPLSSRKSFALLSFPPLRSSESSSTANSSNSASWGRSRGKRPSLHLLFSKKSTPSLKASSPLDLNTSPSSAPAVTTDYTRAPVPTTTTGSQSEWSAGPPSLATPISSSPMDLGFDVSILTAQVETDTSGLAPQDTIRLVHVRTDSSASSLYSTPQETPVADRFRGRLPSVAQSSKSQVAAAPQDILRSPSQLSLTPSITFDFNEDDWAQSVFMAAGTDNDGGKTP